ncbi:MAG: hypothetical protein OEZ68_17625 [Gammaproteobacteria bacterium]|nr:hypothetical protein [Gammaproteobacteria bacterium]MDH5802625.1 hypothetical protein [Gammaproteobacteria bacterium]
MKKLLILLLGVGLLPSVAPAHNLGEKYLAGNRVTVALSKDFVNNERALARNFVKHKGVERLYRNLVRHFKEYRIRRSLKVDVLITEFYSGPGRERLMADVIVTERGEPLDNFIVEETTALHPKIRRLTRGLSKRITKRARMM